MAVFYEVNPPKAGGDGSDQERMEHLAENLASVLEKCGGVLVTDSVLGKQRLDPILMARVISAKHPGLETIVSMRAIDRAAADAAEFASRAKQANVRGVLAVKGDPRPGGTDSGLAPSAAARAMADTIPAYLSIPARPDFAKIRKKIDARPSGFFTQVVSDLGQVRRIREGLGPAGFRIIPCIMVPSEKNSRSAEFLGLDWSEYSGDAPGFASAVHELAGDLLLTSPSDRRAALSLLTAMR